ncbi:glycosyl hydrolase family 65 protein [Bacillaceae bacterium IKA-2]|nr:glycosyl hydrolase family 65 protein [Bacillaceae bacterium IKA-2]
MLNYHSGSSETKGWIVSETEFKPEVQGKCEAIMSLGNGYLGLRSSTEEPYLGQVRNLFVAGTFNKFDEQEVTELPNAADIVELNITLNEEKFSLEKGKLLEYRRDLNLRTGELEREIVWESPKGQSYRLLFKRFVSLNNLRLICLKLEVTPLSEEVEINIASGINAQVTNSGVQHFHEGEKRIFDNQYIQLLQQTTESKIDFVLNSVHVWKIKGSKLEIDPKLVMDRRKVFVEGNVTVAKGETVSFEKISNIYTSRDKEYDNDNYTLEVMRKNALCNLKEETVKGYDELFFESVTEWEQRWAQMEIKVESENEFDQLAIRFAHYHLITMAPGHDNRFGIAAKGLSGEGYKGHSFWDTEIFILPFFTYTYPETARRLLEYRFNTINGARKKAKDNHYEGAMYSWESAFSGEEVTPVWGGVDIVSGKATKIWSGFIEQHITSDIAFAVWQYYKITGDQNFMDQFGYEILFETATFWTSRLEWNDEQNRYHINEVIGPDEYKEHIDNNAFTNYMAHQNIELAITYYQQLQEENRELFNELNHKLRLEQSFQKWQSKIGKIYLPQPREKDLVVPQDDTYLQKEIIDLTKYKNQIHVGSMFEDYNLEQVNNIQVSKQADIMILFYLLENKFSNQIKRANWNYYEPKTLHDSSLSLASHCILASDMDDRDLAYSLFERAAKIDLGPNMKTSDHGIHTASIGGIWQAVVCGFGGVRMLGGELRINAKLPEKWSHLVFPIYWQDDRLEVDVTREGIVIRNVTKKNTEIQLSIHGKEYILSDMLQVKF